MLCYCFQISKDEILAEISRDGKSPVYERVAMLIRANGCECEVKNPKKICCLPDIKRWLMDRSISVEKSCKCCC